LTGSEEALRLKDLSDYLATKQAIKP